jgi:hypothetical protein
VATGIERLADALLGQSDGMDTTDVYESLKPFLSGEDFRNLGAALEFCPLHYCDIRICIDDGLHGDEVYLDQP